MNFWLYIIMIQKKNKKNKGSGPPYTQAVANIRLIGVMLAHLILHLHVNQQQGLSNIFWEKWCSNSDIIMSLSCTL